MARKRRKRNKNRQQTEDQLFGEEENAPLAPGEDFADEDVFKFLKLLGIRIPRKLFKPGGFRCVYCPFRTRKLGSAGRNTLRAHSKKHLNDARAGRHLGWVLWLGVLLIIGALLFVAYSTLGTATLESWIEDRQWIELVGPVLAGISMVLSVAMITFAFMYMRKHRKHWRLAFNTASTLAFTVLLVQIAAVTEIVRLGVEWPWLSGSFFPIGALILTRKKVGLTALDVSRRDLKPRHYIKMFKAKTAEGDSLLIDIYVEIKMMIRRGQLDTSKLELWQRQALITLGILEIKTQD